MKKFVNSRRGAIMVISSLMFASGTAYADINGFGDFSGFTYNQSIGDSGSAPTISPGKIDLTNPGAAESRSLFANIPQNISQFTTSFTYQMGNHSSVFGGGDGFGAAFVLQNSPGGASTVSTDDHSYGYGGIGKSVAISLEPSDAGSNSGYYANGVIGGGSHTTSPVFLSSGHPINVTISYSGSTLHESLLDTVTSASFSTTYLTNISSILGGSTAYIGITADGNGNESADQMFSNFQVNVPEPASFGILAAGTVTMLLRRRRRTF
jgi:hypothetical protein